MYARSRTTNGRRTGWAARGLVAVALGTACLAVAPGVAVAAPVNPTDGQLTAAQQAQQAAAAQVGQITASLAQAQSAAAGAAAAANIALQDYEERQAASEQARAAAEAAAAAAAQAQADLGVGRAEVVAFARDSYKQGSTSSGTLALMTAGGPAELIERAAFLDSVGEHRGDVVVELAALEEQATAADQAAQQAVGEAQTLEAEAATLLASAQQQEVAARGQAAALEAQQTELEGQLAQAQQTLYGLQGARQAAEAYAAQQRTAPPAPARTAAAPSTTAAAPPAANTPASRPVTAPRPVAPPPADTTAGAPTGSVVQRAIAAAQSQHGLPYSWGGGNASGPTYGIPPDTGIYGFDCSGLTQYAYARAGIAIGGTSREQYSKFSNRTVARDDLQAGDLVFWSSSDSPGDIYHVALYIGGGKVVQAPQSGDVVKTGSMWFGNDYFGAVRPTG